MAVAGGGVGSESRRAVQVVKRKVKDENLIRRIYRPLPSLPRGKRSLTSCSRHGVVIEARLESLRRRRRIGDRRRPGGSRFRRYSAWTPLGTIAAPLTAAQAQHFPQALG